MMKKEVLFRTLLIVALLALLSAGSVVLIEPPYAISSELIAAPNNKLIIEPIKPITPITDLIPTECLTNYPNPVLQVVGTESYSANGKNWVRYLLSVVNRGDYSDSLFAPAPDLPPCGLNTNSSRSWVHIYDQDDNYIYGFCALGAADNMGALWFAVEVGETPPSKVYITIEDRLCEEVYTSNEVTITPGLYTAPPIKDLEIQSVWPAVMPVIDGVVTSGEWSGANSLQLNDIGGFLKGSMFVMNDGEALYFLLDMTGDINSGGDVAGLNFDIGQDGFLSTGIDLRYITDTISYVFDPLLPGWTAPQALPSTSLTEYALGTGSTPLLSTSHTFFEIKVDFNEIGIDFDNVLMNPEELYQARMSVMVQSTNPVYNVFYPSHYNSYANAMIRIALDIGSLAISSDAPIISGIGLVPRTFIDQTVPVTDYTGLATTGSGHQIYVTDAPFGGHMRVIGNLDALRDQGVGYYAIGYCNMDLYACNDVESGIDFSQWNFVGDARANYRWDGILGRYVLESVSPTAIYTMPSGVVIKVYPTPSGAVTWYFPNLLFDWRTTGSIKVNSGLYKLHVFAFATNSVWSYIGWPSLTVADGTTMLVRVDNTRPVMTINAIYYGKDEVDACDIIRLDDNDDTLLMNVSAYDPNGYLNNFRLRGLYGDNESFTCHSENYVGFLADGGTGPIWNPAMPNGYYVCEGDAGDHWETTCAYTFYLDGWDRAINGYGRIHYNHYHKSITIIMPDDPICSDIK